MGNYNINIQRKLDDLGDTSDFLDTMYSHAYVPLIKKAHQNHWEISYTDW